ncbi:PQQ-binding-like beta-propeller repeat protein [Planctomycetaceae bacterium SH139]
MISKFITNFRANTSGSAVAGRQSSMTARKSRCITLGLGLAVGSLAALSQPSIAEAADSWKHWRGELAQGVAPEGDYPVSWKSGDAQWRVDLKGRGGSTPVVSGELVFITAGFDGKNFLQAFDANSGELRWAVHLGDDTGGKHKKGSGSNPSPTTDGKYVYAYYRSGDLACVDMSGQVVWQRNLQEDYGQDTLWWDLGSSPLLTDKSIVVAVMQSAPSPSYLASFDKLTGDVVWNVSRELPAPREAAQSYTSPIPATVNGQELIALMGADHLTLHDANTGKILAQLGGFNPEQNEFFRSIASPVVAGNIIICPYARGASVTAVDMAKLLAGAGEQAIVWQQVGIGADVPTPVVRDGRVYLNQDRGQVLALDLESGDTAWELELPKNRKNYSSSPLLTGSHLYLTREDGQVMVIKLPGDAGQPELVSENGLGDDSEFTVASPVPVGDGLLFRTPNSLVMIK